MAKDVVMLKQYSSAETQLDVGKQYRIADTLYAALVADNACQLLHKEEVDKKRITKPALPDPGDELKGASRNTLSNRLPSDDEEIESEKPEGKPGKAGKPVTV